MKKLFLVLGVLLLHVFSYSQINVDPSKLVVVDKAKTIFIYRNSDVAMLDELKTVLAKNWKYNEIELVSLDEIANYKIADGDLVFAINFSHESYTVLYSNGSDLGGNYIHFYLTLSQKDGEDFKVISKANLAISGATIYDLSKGGKGQTEAVRDQYTIRPVYSWNYAYLGVVMNTISQKLKEGGPAYSTKEVQKNDLGELKQKKLYITDVVNIKQNILNGNEKIVKNDKAIDKAYDYDFEIVSNETVSKLAASGEDAYVYMFQKGGSGRHAIVLDLSTMQIVYEEYVVGRFNFDADDIKKLNKAIKRSN